MRLTKLKTRIFSLTAAVLFALLAVFTPFSASADGLVDSARDSVLGYFQSKYSVSDNSSLSREVSKHIGDGSAEWVYLALRSGGSFDGMPEFKTALSELEFDGSAVERQRIGLTMLASGMPDESLKIADSTVGKLGIMSNVFALIIYDSLGSNNYKTPLNALLDSRLSGGGWALYGDRADVDVTAMVITALSKHRGEQEVASAIDDGVAILSKAQLDTGDYSSFGVRNPESGCQTIIALCACGIDPTSDTRFIKNGNSLLDGIMLYQRGDGGFSHTLDGGTNVNSSYQALLALTALSVYPNRSFYDFPMPQSPEISKPPVDESTDTPVESSTPPDESSEPIDESSIPVDESSEAVAESSIPIDESSQFVSETPSQAVSKDAESSQISSDFPTESIDNSSENTPDSGGVTRKIIVALIIAVLGALVLAVLKLTKRLNKNLLLTVMILVTAVIVLSFTVDIKTPNEYSAEAEISREFDYYISFTLDYGEASGPASGEYSVGVIRGETVLDVLRRFAVKNDIAVDLRGSYVRGIGGVYEYDISSSSGWMYEVNGEYPMITAVDYLVAENDVIIWRYVS